MRNMPAAAIVVFVVSTGLLEMGKRRGWLCPSASDNADDFPGQGKKAETTLFKRGAIPG